MAFVNIFDMADTWNDGATAFTAIKMDVTDTASASGSKLVDLLVGGVSKFSIDKDGHAAIAGDEFQLSSGVASGTSFVYSGSNDTGAIIIGHSTTTNAPIMSSFNQLRFKSTHRVGWTAGAVNATLDTLLYRDAAQSLAQRDGVNSNVFRVYQTFTDASNYERGELTGRGVALSSAGTGAANIDFAITPAGTGRVKFGTHTAIGSETLSGYVEIKDAAGTVRKLAVIS